MKKVLYKTYKFYSEKGQRLAIFALEGKVGGTLDIYITRCSEKDSFDKKVANMALSYYLESPTAAKKVSKIKVEKFMELTVSQSTPKKDFLLWCRTKFCQIKKISTIIEYPTLVRFEENEELRRINGNKIVKEYKNKAKEVEINY